MVVSLHANYSLWHLAQLHAKTCLIGYYWTYGLKRHVVHSPNDTTSCNIRRGCVTSLPPANEVCEGYVFTPVSQSFCSQGGCAWWWGACVVGGHAWLGVCAWKGGMHGRGACMPCTPHQILQDTVNERVVRILLECILV